MKKILFAIIILITINVKAYENDYFKIDIPDNYIFDNSIKGIYKWTNNDNDRESIIITFSTNTNNDNIKTYSENDINKYEDYIENNFNEQLKEYNVSIEINNTKKEIINGYYTISYDALWPTKDFIGYDIYQKGYSFTTKNYVYICTFTSDNNLSNNELLTNSIKTINLLDKEIIDIKTLQVQLIIIIGSIAAVIGYIIRTIIKRHRSK